MIAVFIILGVAAGIVVLTIATVAFVGREYDRHTWVRRFLDAWARAQGYIPPGDDLPSGYLDQIPGWDDLDASSRH